MAVPTGACYVKDPETGQMICKDNYTKLMCQNESGQWVEGHTCASALSPNLGNAFGQLASKAIASDADKATAIIEKAMKDLAGIAVP